MDHRQPPRPPSGPDTPSTSMTNDSTRSGLYVLPAQTTEANASSSPAPETVRPGIPPPSHIPAAAAAGRSRGGGGGGGAQRRTSVGTLRSNISSTQEQLSAVLDQICKLDSYRSRSEASTAAAVSSSRDHGPDAASLRLVSESSSSSSTKTTSTEMCSQVEAEVAMHHANAIFAQHISLLKEYNEIKDIAMGMLSLMADKEGRRLVEVMEERGLSERD